MTNIPWIGETLDKSKINNGNEYPTNAPTAISVVEFDLFVKGILQSNADSEAAMDKSTTAEVNSATALTKATTAEINSVNAIETATVAEDKSDSAITTATIASDKANTANEKSDTAILTANNTIETANNANEKSDEAKTKATTAEANSAMALTKSTNAESVAMGIDGKATTALSKSVIAETNSVEAKRIAQEALEQVVEEQGTKVTVGGILQSTFNADLKADVAAVNAELALKASISALENLGGVGRTSETVKNNATEITNLKNQKVDVSSIYTKSETDSKLAEKQTKNIVVSNISVPTSAWVADSLFEFCATVTVTEAREIHVPNVFFDIDGSALKILYNFSSCADGTVTIYASEIPTVTVVIDKIVFTV